MLDPKHFTVVAGQAVVDKLNEIASHEVSDNTSLIHHQVNVARMGYLGAEIVRTIRGWSLRYDSGLQDFGLIQGGLATYNIAVQAAISWQDNDPHRRYAFVRNASKPI